jgi:hypothetical protein
VNFILFIIFLVILGFIIENIVSISIIVSIFFIVLLYILFKPSSKKVKSEKNNKTNSYQKHLRMKKYYKNYPLNIQPFFLTNGEKGDYMQRGWCNICELWCMFIIEIKDSQGVDEYSYTNRVIKSGIGLFGPKPTKFKYSEKYLGTNTSITYNCKCSLCDSESKGFKIKQRHDSGKNFTLVGEMWDSTIHDTSWKQPEGLSFRRMEVNDWDYKTKRDNMIEQRLVRSKGLRRFNQRLMALNMKQINSIEMACDDDGFIDSVYLAVFMRNTPELEDKNKTKSSKPRDLYLTRLHRLVREIDTLSKLKDKSIINEEESEKKKEEIILNYMEFRYSPLNVILSMGKRELRKSLEVKK